MAAELRSSPDGGPPATHTVRNLRTFPARLFWLDYEGRAVPYGEVLPEASLNQETYANHAWRICDERSGLALLEYVGPSAAVTLAEDGSVRVLAGGAPPTAAAAPPTAAAPAPAAAPADEAGVPALEEDRGSEED
ncbi:von Hippel-Lindau disease tumor suppressor isoform X1 isoform A [Micractinium conductrix]|uniref:von Hippel-Lindau disease tumor suppressor isoform X1 isoform A n=1 Tax=Micractinium conductrix TaxID=554055 RepID=A0A2P6UZZ3_9CHLO|nr:von Hippel-Lindau disease tumor suppressor isoform X1 isoform B [Micractinium conductrix]PSC67410.1 von Hippel-Lindau disease tumor suppressor isoform X1 isoform A [Micractinium conductrix]|eukprot:PSC67409.1 von Hippel-Lindau disease tumor suppressor isoform X1 isoform B [Micractinium conductrix]